MGVFTYGTYGTKLYIISHRLKHFTHLNVIDKYRARIINVWDQNSKKIRLCCCKLLGKKPVGFTDIM